MSQEKLSRRDLLKMLAAATGAAVLSTVPTKWKTPVVEIGALPAHAQGSRQQPGAIAGTITVRFQDGPTRGKKPLISAFTVSVLTTALQVNLDFNNGNSIPYQINNVPPGTWTVQCVYNFCSNTQTFSNVQVLPGVTTNNIDFNFTDCPA